jgi:hypothetical protein
LDAKNGSSHPAQIMKKPRRGGGASSVPLGNNVTGGSRHWFWHSTWVVENNPLNHEHFVMTCEEAPACAQVVADCRVCDGPPLL